MRKIAIALAVACSVVAVNKPAPAKAQAWWVAPVARGVVGGLAAYGAYRCWNFGCGRMPPHLGYGYAWGRPRYSYYAYRHYGPYGPYGY
jgi:hypothetical protein